MQDALGFPGVNFQSATLADFGGLVEGSSLYFTPSDGIQRRYVLVKAGVSVANNLLVTKDSTSGSLTVSLTATAAAVPLGVNNTGATITSGNYFLACQGPKYVAANDAALASAGVKLQPDASTNGNVEAYAATAGNVCVGLVHTTAGGAGTVTVYGWLGNGL